MSANKGLFLSALAALIITGCATTHGDDPLKNTKKLVAEGHASLYRNGAFQVPNTEISLIPAGPSATEFAFELMGMRARQSFVLSVQRAADSVYIVSEGTRMTYRWAKDIHEGTDKASDAIRESSREGGIAIVHRSTELGGQIIGKTWDTSTMLFTGREEAGNAIVQGSRQSGNAIIDAGSGTGGAVIKASVDAAAGLSSSSVSRSKETFGYAGKSFVKGYAAVPGNVKQRASSTGESLAKMNPLPMVEEGNAWRSEWSGKSIDLMSETLLNYGKDVSGAFSRAGQELSGNFRTTGVSLAVLKSMRWVLKGLLWDATIEPATKLTAASLGYISVNFLAFPTVVVMQEGVATATVAVEATWNTARTAYDLVAPTGIAAVAGVFGAADLAGSHALAGATATVGTAAGAGIKAVSGVAGVTVKGAGYAAGKGVQYIGIPLASAGIAVGGGAIGTAVGAVGATTGGTVLVAGESAAAGTFVFGNVIAGTTAAGGAAASTAAGAAYGVYQVSKAVAVPAGYELGGGMVLSYETMTQLAAQSILAASDCAYLVLSLEGPRWVIYAVKGNLGSGDDLPSGAVLDLKEMRQQGEAIYNVPVSDEEMKKVVESVYWSLPQTGLTE